MGKSDGQWRIGLRGDESVHYTVGQAAVPDRVDPDLAIRYLIGTSAFLPETSRFPTYWRCWRREYVEKLLSGQAPLLGDGDRAKGTAAWNFAKRTDREQMAALRKA